MVKIVQGDTLETLKGMADDSVDIIVTSPPYNNVLNSMRSRPASGMMRGNKFIQKVTASAYPDSQPEGEYQDWLREVVGECLRVAKGLVWVNHKIRYVKQQGIHPARMLPFPIYSEIVWDRGGSFALNCRKYAPSHEVVYGFGKKHFWDRRNDTKMSVWRIAPERGSEHPCPYPLEIPRRLIASSCPPGGIVLDPFCGSGTTGVAAVELGMSFIGIEREERFVELSRRRIGACEERE